MIEGLRKRSAYHDIKLFSGILAIKSDMDYINRRKNGAKFDSLSTDSIVDVINRFNNTFMKGLKRIG